MIKLKKPIIDQDEIISECLSNMKNGSRKANILSSKTNIINKSDEYDNMASKGELYRIVEHDIVEGGATSKDMKAVYEQKFVPIGGSGRKYYDKLMLLAPNDRCPYCGQRIVKTLDHYLPKSLYPTYAITPFNLVPSCSECNKSKSNDSTSTFEGQVIHPYYDDFADEIWISAEVVEEEPITFRFFVSYPEGWTREKFERAKKHFKDFKLNSIYKSHASEEYISCENRLKRVYNRGGKKAVIEFLEESIEDKLCVRKNTWQAAMYQALIDSEWYWNKYILTKF